MLETCQNLLSEYGNMGPCFPKKPLYTIRNPFFSVARMQNFAQKNCCLRHSSLETVFGNLQGPD
jgi:hypothetical protein